MRRFYEVSEEAVHVPATTILLYLRVEVRQMASLEVQHSIAAVLVQLVFRQSCCEALWM